MSEITKMFAAVGIVAGGFFSASLFGPPQQEFAAQPESANDSRANWAPTRLEPLQTGGEQFAQEDFHATGSSLDDSDSFSTSGGATPPQAWDAPRSWDRNVAPASHFDSVDQHKQAYVGQSPDSAWPTRRLEPLPIAEPHSASYRGVDMSPSNSARASDDTRSPALSDARFSTLSPPNLLSAEADAKTRQARFPQRPVESKQRAMSREPFTGPLLRDPTFAPLSDDSGQDHWGTKETRAWSMSMPLPSQDARTREPGRVLKHVVSDGDSLAKLAERYLRDANRAREIYELNQDVLTSPDLLPIGVQLQVPARRSGEYSEESYEVYDSQGSATTRFTPQRSLSPLPAVSGDVQPAPRAWLQRPVEATFAGSEG